jgi:hypothetical protein
MSRLSDDVVKLTEVATEAEAATLCGYLEARGIPATYDNGGTSSGLAAYSGPGGGRQQIVVPAGELAAAREALAALDTPSDADFGKEDGV